MSHHKPRTGTNSKGALVQSNWGIDTVEDGLFRCANPACRREFSAWSRAGSQTNPERRILLTRATARSHADRCTKEV